MPDTAPAPEPGAPTPDSGKPASSTTDRLPDDHPLVKAYQATKNELAGARTRVKEFEDATKSETEKLTDRATKAEEALTPLQRENARLKVAIAKRLPADLVDRLKGDTVEELEADADALLKLVGRSTAPSFDGGTRQPTPAGEGDMNAFISRARAARRG